VIAGHPIEFWLTLLRVTGLIFVVLVWCLLVWLVWRI